MELHSTIYISLKNQDVQANMLEILEEGELDSNSLQSILPDGKASSLVDELFTNAGVDPFFSEEAYEKDGYIVASLVAPNGAEESLIPLVDFFYAVFPEPDVRIKGEGEEMYFVFIRRDNGKTEMRYWEEDDPEVLLEDIEWFNDGLPESLQETEIDFY